MSKFTCPVLWAIESERCRMWHFRISPLTDLILMSSALLLNFSTVYYQQQHCYCQNYKPVRAVHGLYLPKDNAHSTLEICWGRNLRCQIPALLKSIAVQFTLTDFHVNHSRFRGAQAHQISNLTILLKFLYTPWWSWWQESYLFVTGQWGQPAPSQWGDALVH